MTPDEIEKLLLELSIRRFSRTGTTELICSKAAEAITQLRADLISYKARQAAFDAMLKALKGLVELCDNANEGAFKNGVTDQTGSIDQGEVWASDYLRNARAAIALAEKVKGEANDI